MAISELIQVVPPPAQPIDALDDGLWSALEETLGVRLPPDWHDFGVHYGSGEFGTHGGYEFWNPFAPDTLGWIRLVIDVLRGNKEAWPEYGVPFDLHPANLAFSRGAQTSMGALTVGSPRERHKSGHVFSSRMSVKTGLRSLQCP